MAIKKQQVLVILEAHQQLVDNPLLCYILEFFLLISSRFLYLSFCWSTVPSKHVKKRDTFPSRWFKVIFCSPSWRSLNLSKRSLNHLKKVTSRIARLWFFNRHFFLVGWQDGTVRFWEPFLGSGTLQLRRRFAHPQYLLPGRWGVWCEMRGWKGMEKCTLPKFNSSPLKSFLPNRKVVFQPLFFRGYVKLRGCICFKVWS